ncbi:serine hydrolase-like protein [Gadus chalcogrammus]|uniref:serine hydrolase-like protein n=1 Tax=Gadus chalcogrammus TaxID=1042646 RepID=UPI0024C31342|nr:serine hydrolase-like protein [Gadus chalcogrammus]
MMQTVKNVRHLVTSTKHAVSELTVPVPWGQIRGKVWGPDHGRRVVCLHGWADNCGTFDTLLPLLPQDYKYVAFDLPGHGQSSHRPPGVPYYFQSYVADLYRLVKALQWEKFSIIGHSMGGNIGGMFSALYPEMVDALVLLDSYGFLPTDVKEMPEVMRQGMEELLKYENREERVYTKDQAFQRLQAGNPTLSEQSARILLERGTRQVEGGLVFSRDFRINLKNIMRFSTEQCLELQSRITTRVLVLLAEEGFEKRFAESNQTKLISTILQGYREPNGVVVTLPGDHHVHLNHPESVAPSITDFLQSNGPSNLTSSAEDPEPAKL